MKRIGSSEEDRVRLSMVLDCLIRHVSFSCQFSNSLFIFYYFLPFIQDGVLLEIENESHLPTAIVHPNYAFVHYDNIKES